MVGGSVFSVTDGFSECDCTGLRVLLTYFFSVGEVNVVMRKND